MLSLSDALLGLGLPALCGAILFIVLRRAVGNAAVFAVGAGFLVGYVAINRSSWIPLSEPAHYVLLGTGAILLIAAIHELVWQNAWFWHIGTLLILAGVIAGVFVLLADPEWTGTQKAIWGFVLWLASALMTIALEFRCRRAAAGDSASDDFVVALTLAIVAGLSAAVIGMSGTQTYGRIAAVIPTTLAPIVLLSLLFRTKVASPRIVALYVVAVDGMLLCTFLYAALTPLNAILLSLSSLGLCVDYVHVVHKRAAWQRGAFQLLVSLVPAGIAFGIALIRFLRDMSTEFGSY
jgi:hypothetical protein